MVRRIVRVAMDGLLSPDDAARCIREIDASVERVNRLAGPNVTLVDLSRSTTQTQAVAELSRQYFETFTNKPLRLAIVVGRSDLHRFQVKRIVGSEPVAFFGDTATAEAWIAEGHMTSCRRRRGSAGRVRSVMPCVPAGSRSRPPSPPRRSS